MIKRRPQQPVDALEAASCKEEDDEDGEGRSVASGPRRSAKSCKLCDAKPSDPTPLVSDSPLQLQWGGPTIPWGSGIPGRAVGGYDKICLRTFDAGSFRHEYTTIGAYHTTISKNPEKHERFLKARENWIERHSENPSGRVSTLQCLSGVQEVNKTTKGEDALEAPEEEFVELSVWQEEMKDKLPEELRKKGVLPTPAMFGLEEVTEIFRNKAMRGVNVMTGKAGHYKRRQTYSTSIEMKERLDGGEGELLEGQTDTIFNSARAITIAKHGDIAKALETALSFLAPKAVVPVESDLVDLSMGLEDSDAEDLAADALVESKMGMAGAGRAPAASLVGKIAYAKASAKAASKGAASSSSGARAIKTPPVSSPAKPAASASSSTSKRGSKAAQADKFNKTEADKLLADLKPQLNVVKQLGTFMDTSVTKVLVEFQKVEKKGSGIHRLWGARLGQNSKRKGSASSRPGE